MMEPLNIEPLQPMHPMPLSMMDRIRNNYILQARLVIALCFVFGAGLAGVNIQFNPLIEANKINETKQRVPELILGTELAQTQSLNIEPRAVEVQKPGRTLLYNVYEARYPDGKLAGWVTKAKGQGYADKIELLIGMDPGMEKITGLYILEQKETPGLGNKIVTKEWRSQFIQKLIRQPLTVVKPGCGGAPHQVDAISGATISSQAVTSIINAAVRDLRKPLTEQGGL